MNHRDFVQNAVAVGLASAAATAQATPPASKKMIGIQVGAVSFVDEGVAKVLDVFQQSAYVNTLCPKANDYAAQRPRERRRSRQRNETKTRDYRSVYTIPDKIGCRRSLVRDPLVALVPFRRPREDRFEIDRTSLHWERCAHPAAWVSESRHLQI